MPRKYKKYKKTEDDININRIMSVNIIFHRETAGFTRTELAKQSSVERNRYYACEKIPDDLTIGEARRIAKSLGLKGLDELFFYPRG